MILTQGAQVITFPTPVDAASRNYASVGFYFAYTNPIGGAAAISYTTAPSYDGTNYIFNRSVNNAPVTGVNQGWGNSIPTLLTAKGAGVSFSQFVCSPTPTANTTPVAIIYGNWVAGNSQN